MKKFIIAILALIIFGCKPAPDQPVKSAEKLKRSDCFFGVHFDLHASEDIMDAGKTLTAEMIDTFITRVRPDFIQVDCKGHPGISSYPTKVGYPVKGFEKDPLKLWREVTEKNHVALFMHFSGVWDNKVVEQHPSWAVINSNGEQSRQKTSFFSSYRDTYMIPQLKELSDYGVDGAWIDGECWAVEPDYGKASLERFTNETGIKEIPRKPSDPFYAEFIDYTRTLFREHLGKYVDAIHQYNPQFQVTSNWAYSSMMPEEVNIDVDYLSGDVTPQNGVYRAAFEARCLAPQGKPWDLMAWGFSWDGGKMPMSIKTQVQLEQEAAQVMAMGGGIQFYFQQNRDLSIKPWLSSMLIEIARFCRERQRFCHKSTQVPQIALLYPTDYYRKSSSRPFAGSTQELQGMLDLVLDSQHPVEILMEHHLAGNMDRYPLIIIPECDYLESAFMEELKQYVIRGGNLLIIGSATAKLFEKELGIRSSEPVAENKAFIANSNRIGAIRSALLSVELLPEAGIREVFYDGSDFRQKGNMIASSVNSVGHGKAAGVYFNAGSSYSDYRNPVLRDFISSHISELFPGQMVNVEGSHLVHLAVNRLNDRMYIHLLNVAGEHINPSATGYDEIPSLKDLVVKINTEKRPAMIILQPEGRRLDVDFKEGVAEIRIPDLAIHSILEVITED
ncbi:MAG TPA: hypothetical protein VI583_04350 [Cyclobacteriaceae bacterium]|nr:hypothetical protein [Cyclobacteriaceae bacterium]